MRPKNKIIAKELFSDEDSLELAVSCYQCGYYNILKFKKTEKGLELV